MKIGLQITGMIDVGGKETIGSQIKAMARAADEGGFSSLWFPDHLLNAMSVFGKPIDEPHLEGYTTLSYCAAVTERLKLGLLVTCNYLRHPAVLVKMVTTLDVLSCGRAYLGIGAGWFEREANGLGITFPSKSERLRRLEETLKIAKHLWSNKSEPFIGRYYKMNEPIITPDPVSKPHPPILVGGAGEKVTLKLVAKYGDACNLFIGSMIEGLPPAFGKIYENRSEILRGKLSILKKHCENVKRDYEEIEKTVQVYAKIAPNANNAEDIIELCHELKEYDVQHVIIMSHDMDVASVKAISREVVPTVDRL